MSASTLAHYNVRFVLDRAIVSTTVVVPYHDHDDDYDDDPAAIDVAQEFLSDHYGIDVSGAIDVDVELDGITE
jgi:hypothetical protein